MTRGFERWKGEESRARFSAGGSRERLVLACCVFGALVVLAFGSYLAWYDGDPHWINRAGAAIVALEGVLLIVEFGRTRRLERLRRLSAVRNLAGIAEEIERAERTVLLFAASVAIFGEILHGFGDLVIGDWIVGAGQLH
jgi:hypothetical protein